MQIWEKTEAYHDYVTFFIGLNESVEGLPVSAKIEFSDNSKAIVELLDTIDKWIDENPPIDQPQRFGNQAFRSWYKKLTQVMFLLLTVKLSK